MPSDTTPRLRLTTWDKVSVYALSQLTADNQSTWFCTDSIKERATTIIRQGLANVSSNPGAVGMVSSCLNRLAVAGIVTRESRRIRGGRRRQAYKLNVEHESVLNLAEALQAEATAVGNFDSRYNRLSRHSDVVYRTCCRILHNPTSNTQPETQASSAPRRAGGLQLNPYRPRRCRPRLVAPFTEPYVEPVRVTTPTARGMSLHTLYNQKRAQALQELGLS